MKRFRFPLEGLLRLRRLREQESRRQLAEALKALRHAEAACQAARALVREAEQGLVGSLQASELRGWAEALERRRQQLAGAERLREEAARRAETLWAHFLQLRRDRKAVEQVRQRRWRLYQRELGRREQAQADELVLIRRGRKG